MRGFILLMSDRGSDILLLNVVLPQEGCSQEHHILLDNFPSAGFKPHH